MRLLALVLAVTGVAAAGPINGTLGWIPMGNGVSFSGPTLGSATSVTIAGTEVVDTVPLTFNGAPNDYAPFLAVGDLVLVPVMFHTLTVTNINGGLQPDALPDYASWGHNNTFRFTLDILKVAWSSSAANPNALALMAQGTLVDHKGVFENTPGLLSAAFTTTGAGAVNVSFTVSSEQATVSELSSGLSTLVGVALIGWLSAGRRRALRR